MGDNSWNASDGEEDIDEDEEVDVTKGGRDAVIFVIEASLSMFQKDDEDEPFRLAIQACHSTLRNKIIGSEKDLVGIMFYGTKKKVESNDFKGIVVLSKLSPPTADTVKKMEKMKNSEDFDSFESQYGHSDDYLLMEVFWLCKIMFSKAETKLGEKQVLFFTNNDNPLSNPQQKKLDIMKQITDFKDSDIQVSLLNLGKQFDVNKFYTEVLELSGENGTLTAGIDKLEDLMRVVHRRQYKKRTVGKFFLSLATGVKLGVGLYNFVRPTKKPYAQKLHATTNEEVKRQTTLYDDAIGETLMASDISKYQEYAGKRLICTPEDVKKMRSFSSDPGLVVLGFKDKSSVVVHHFLRPASFLYPDEGLVKGSGRMFSCMLRRCIAKDKVVLCRFIPRKNSSPRLVALYPQMEKKNQNGIQIDPPGFHVVFLPFADDMRHLNLEESTETKAQVDQIEAAKGVLKKMRFRYDVSMISNPALQKHWIGIEALALERDDIEDEEEPFTDDTQPDAGHLEEKVGPSARKFMNAVFPNGNPEMSKTRAPPKSSGGPPAKRAKDQVMDFDIEALANQGKVHSLSVDKLKMYLQSVNKKVSGKKKADLVEEVYTHFNVDAP